MHDNYANAWKPCRFMTTMQIHEIMQIHENHVNSWKPCIVMTTMQIHGTPCKFRANSLSSYLFFVSESESGRSFSRSSMWGGSFCGGGLEGVVVTPPPHLIILWKIYVGLFSVKIFHERSFVKICLWRFFCENIFAKIFLWKYFCGNISVVKCGSL